MTVIIGYLLKMCTKQSFLFVDTTPTKIVICLKSGGSISQIRDASPNGTRVVKYGISKYILLFGFQGFLFQVSSSSSILLLQSFEISLSSSSTSTLLLQSFEISSSSFSFSIFASTLSESLFNPR